MIYFIDGKLGVLPIDFDGSAEINIGCQQDNQFNLLPVLDYLTEQVTHNGQLGKDRCFLYVLRVTFLDQSGQDDSPGRGGQGQVNRGQDLRCLKQ